MQKWPVLRPMAWVVCAALISGCAPLQAPQSAALRAGTHASSLPVRAELTDAPFFAQERFQCGPAALATALTHAGLDTDPAELAETVFLPAREGSLQAEMITGARRRGAVATVLPHSLDALLREVAAGHGVVVLQNLGLRSAPRWHYAVLVGYDLARGEVVLRSATTRREILPLATFEHTWARGGHWAIVVLPPGDVPIAALEAEAVRAVAGFERVAPFESRLLAWRGLLERWPGSVSATVGLANALARAGSMVEATQVLESGGTPIDSVVVWNNLARLRLALGDAAGARQAAQEAVRRAEFSEPGWLEAAQATQALTASTSTATP